MQKKVIRAINAYVEEFMQQYDGMDKLQVYRMPLRSCQAHVRCMLDRKSGRRYYELWSYRTRVAIMDDYRLFDVLRYVYGYTATSAQHISKFAHDYAPDGQYQYVYIYRWRDE